MNGRGGRVPRACRCLVRIACLALLAPGLCAGARAASAQPGADQPAAGIVRVTAGEHGDFSRIVLALGTVPDYRVQPELRGLRVVFPGARFRFDYDRTDLEGRARRIRAAEPRSGADGSSFHLSFDCACIGKTFVYDGKLVVDVFDSERPESAAMGRERAGGADDGAPPPSLPDGTSEASSRPPRVEQRDGLADSGPQAAPRPEFVRRVENVGQGPQPGPPPDGPVAGSDFDGGRLRSMLAWAVDQGHLTAADPDDGASGPADQNSQRPEIQAPVRDVASQSHGRPASAARAPKAEAEGRDDVCPRDGVLDAAQAGAGAFAEELARRQEDLSLALAREDGVEDAQLALASFYLARLMPQEALDTLADLDGEAQEESSAAWLRAGALLLAGRSDEIAGRAWRGATCPDADVALWRAAIVAGRGGADMESLAVEEVLDRLQAYPASLGAELGLRLAEASVDAHAAEVAGRLLQMVEAGGPEGRRLARLLFLKGRLAALRGDFAGAREKWRQAGRLPGEYGLRATVAMLGALSEQGAPIGEDALRRLELLAFDWRGHDLQLELARLATDLLEPRGRVGEALRMLEDVALNAPGEPSARAAARLATDLLRRVYANPSAPPGPERLSLFWRYEGFVPPGPDGADIRLGIARALVAHDLPSPAEKVLAPLVEDAQAPVRAKVITLLAKARLLSGQPEAALELLRSEARRLTGSRPERDLLAARALARLGRFAEAAGVLHGRSSAEILNLRADYLWSAGLWGEAFPVHVHALEQARRAGDEEAASRAVVRAAAAAYMAGGIEALGSASKAALEDAADDRGAAALTAMLSRASAGAGLRARASALFEQAAGLAELAAANRLEG